jgi:hypothetical protein
MKALWRKINSGNAFRCNEKALRKKLSRQTLPSRVSKFRELRSHSNAHESEHAVTPSVQIPEQRSATAGLPTPLLKLDLA